MLNVKLINKQQQQKKSEHRRACVLEYIINNKFEIIFKAGRFKGVVSVSIDNIE